MRVEFAGDHFVGGLHDQLGFFGRELAEILIDQRRRLFQDAERANQLGRHRVAADIEMNQRTRGLRAVVAVGGDFDLAHAVGFDARGHGACDRRRRCASVSSHAGLVYS